MEKSKFYSQLDHKRMDSWSGLGKGTSEGVMADYEKIRREPLSGIETAELVSRVYEILGADIGCRLIEPNIVLAMSGMKGHADMHWVRLDNKKIEELKLVNSKLEIFGLELCFPKKIEGDCEIRGITFANLKGIERKSKTTKIPGVPLFDSRTGRDGLMMWNKEIETSLAKTQKEGKISEEVNLEVILEGINLGYPDQAILDFEKCLREGKVHEDLLEADIISSIPEAEKYQGAVPEFDYYPEHKDDPEIVEYIFRAKEILKEFYNSVWFRGLSQKQEFYESRQAAIQTKKEGFSNRNFKKGRV